MNRLLHRLLYALLPLPLYLRVVSGMLFLYVRLGFGRTSRATEYIFHLPKLISKGGVAIDIGANLGYYSLPLSKIVGETGRVYSVEPVPIIFEVLGQRLKRRRNVELLNVALGTKEEQITMSNSSVAECGYFGTGQNEVGSGTSESAVEFKAQMVQGSKLFGNLERLDLIKCDIEGYESVVIPEILPIIKRHRPVILLESGGESRERMIELIEGVGYKRFTLVNGEEISEIGTSDKDLIFRPKREIQCE